MFKSLLSWGVVKAMIFKGIRWVATAVSGYVASFLIAQLHRHGLSTDGSIGGYIQTIAEGVGTIAAGAGALGFSLLDAPKVAAKMQTVGAVAFQAGAAGQISQADAVGRALASADDPQQRAAIAAAQPPGDLEQVPAKNKTDPFFNRGGSQKGH